jgi:hypothetical protein
MELKNIVLGQWDGAGDGWQASLPLRAYDSTEIVVDAQGLRFATPTFLLRLRSFVEWHLGEGRTVRVLRPANANVANYMARMHLGDGLPDGMFDLPEIRERDRSEVLIPVTRLLSAQDVDRFNEEVAPVIRAHADDVAVLEEAISMAIAELCGNGVEHGANSLGCYAAVQRYPAKRKTVLAIGDLGCGIPANIRRCFPEIESDPAALEHALQEGVTTTGKTSRGQGFYWVMDAAQQSHIRSANLDVRAGRGHVSRTFAPGGPVAATTADAPNKRGTWATLELGPKS